MHQQALVEGRRQLHLGEEWGNWESHLAVEEVGLSPGAYLEEGAGSLPGEECQRHSRGNEEGMVDLQVLRELFKRKEIYMSV